jgi:hypothetical protein
MRLESWYKLEDGSLVPPDECTAGPDGAVTHKTGKIAATHKDGIPIAVVVDGDEERAKMTTRELKPEEPKKAYKTRESKAV